MERVLRIQNLWDGTPARPEEVVAVTLAIGSGLSIKVDAPFHDDLPPPGPPGPTEKLWEHEVVEIFVAGAPDEDGVVEYVEIELGPRGHHLVLRLRGERNIVEERLPLTYSTQHKGDRWIGRAMLAGSLLPHRPYRVNATAIHGGGAKRRYLSWQPLPGDTPDFHQLDAFVDWRPRRR